MTRPIAQDSPSHPIAPDTAADPRGPAGAFVTFEGESFYRISAYHRLRPFLMSIASDTDLWMFVTSGGGLTAGRKDPEGALFPYETVDKLHDSHPHTGPVTMFRVQPAGGPAVLWQPFAGTDTDDRVVERNLYKNVIGNRLVFEEVRHDLGLAFRHRWSGSDPFGLVRTATLVNLGDDTVAVALLDGLRNVLPHGVPLALYQHSSSLVDAYKRTDLDPGTGLATFSLTAKILDRAEAAEQLTANTVWCHGLADARVGLSLDAIDAFRHGESLPPARSLTGGRGHYLATSSLALGPHASVRWHMVADTGRSHVQIAALRARLLAEEDLGAAIDTSLDEASGNLLRIVAGSDGVQLTGHPEAAAHHFASVLFNDMRGGVFAHDHDVPVADLGAFLRTRNRPVAERHAARLAALPAAIPVTELIRLAGEWGDPHLVRLCHEYLPLYFGRRHGDPSRPWNRFSIQVRNPDGSRALSYEGNWRDVFQNWEALALSFPDFLPNFIARFVNASTVDGFNPYRITRDGVDWEVIDPRDPWSNIGYWGDHQIVYLLRLLEALERSSPGALGGLLARAIFSYADVPYRLRPHDEIVADPRATIVYDTQHAARIAARVAATGTDGKLVHGADGDVLHVSLLEKLLVPALSKLSNLVPDGGIWMNTQRPEWNDANNALVGNGVSLVTLFQLRRHLAFLERLFGAAGDTGIVVSAEVITWLRRLHGVLADERPLPGVGPRTDRDRMRVMDALGMAFSDYRARVYAHGPGAKQSLPPGEAAAFCRVALEHLDPILLGSRREDGLYHSYQLLEISPDRCRTALRPLEEMLEGQVAALASGLVRAPEAVVLLERLFESRLYRADQRSFMLYPEKTLPSFMSKNVVPGERVAAVPLLVALLAAGDPTILARDAAGVHRFAGELRHAADLGAALDRLTRDARWTAAVPRDRQAVLDLFESVFRHHAFTGRSGTMYAYEGIGSIYWHMVAKLLLAVREIARDAARDGTPAETRAALARMYHRIRGGLGFEKTVSAYGAFPTDPYSHTPRHAGAQQPGMTGQVKEEILTRFGELGVEIEDGRVSFRPELLRPEEFLGESGEYRLPDAHGRSHVIALPPGSLAFSFCQVPVTYTREPGEAWIRVTRGDGTISALRGDRLDEATSRALFARRGGIARIDVGVPPRARGGE